MLNVFYVYVHQRADDFSAFYVGKGKNHRAFRKKRNAKWCNIVKKHGYVIKIIAESLTEKDAFDLEIKTIKELKTRDFQGGANFTDGGEGSSGVIPSSETRTKMSLANHRRKGEKRKPWSDETRSKLSRVGKKNSMFGKKHSKESIEKMRNAQIGKKHKPRSEESKIKQSLALKGRKFSPEHIENMKRSAKNRKRHVISIEITSKILDEDFQ